MGLFTNVSSGVADIFYEPFNGVVMHGNKELGIGIAKVRGLSIGEIFSANPTTGSRELRKEDCLWFERQYDEVYEQCWQRLD